MAVRTRGGRVFLGGAHYAGSSWAGRDCGVLAGFGELRGMFSGLAGDEDLGCSGGGMTSSDNAPRIRTCRKDPGARPILSPSLLLHRLGRHCSFVALLLALVGASACTESPPTALASAGSAGMGGGASASGGTSASAGSATTGGATTGGTTSAGSGGGATEGGTSASAGAPSGGGGSASGGASGTGCHRQDHLLGLRRRENPQRLHAALQPAER